MKCHTQKNYTYKILNTVSVASDKFMVGGQPDLIPPHSPLPIKTCR